MRKLHVVNIARRHYPVGVDGVRLDLGIDQFPVREENLDSETGLPMNDIAILINAQASSSSSRFEAVASRLRALTPQTKGKTLDELWRDWRPAWCQSPAEVKEFVSWYNSTYPEDAIKTDDGSTTNTVTDGASSDDGTQTSAESK